MLSIANDGSVFVEQQHVHVKAKIDLEIYLRNGSREL
jgi:hypothetical protein